MKQGLSLFIIVLIGFSQFSAKFLKLDNNLSLTEADINKLAEALNVKTNNKLESRNNNLIRGSNQVALSPEVDRISISSFNKTYVLTNNTSNSTNAINSTNNNTNTMNTNSSLIAISNSSNNTGSNNNGTQVENNSNKTNQTNELLTNSTTINNETNIVNQTDIKKNIENTSAVLNSTLNSTNSTIIQQNNTSEFKNTTNTTVEIPSLNHTNLVNGTNLTNISSQVNVTREAAINNTVANETHPILDSNFSTMNISSNHSDFDPFNFSSSIIGVNNLPVLIQLIKKDPEMISVLESNKRAENDVLKERDPYSYIDKKECENNDEQKVLENYPNLMVRSANSLDKIFKFKNKVLNTAYDFKEGNSHKVISDFENLSNEKADNYIDENQSNTTKSIENKKCLDGLKITDEDLEQEVPKKLVIYKIAHDSTNPNEGKEIKVEDIPNKGHYSETAKQEFENNFAIAAQDNAAKTDDSINQPIVNVQTDGVEDIDGESNNIADEQDEFN